MLISEFIDRTGFRPIEDYYHTVIEPEYNASCLEKDAWCKQWKKNGGIQKAYDAIREQAANVLNLENEVKKLKEKISHLKEMNDNQSHTIRDEREKIHQFDIWKDEVMTNLIEISETYSSKELRDLIIETIGFKAYITYKLENGKTLWKIDKEAIIENLK